MTMNTTNKIQIGPTNPDGKVFGTSASDNIAFYGATPLAQRAGGSGSGVAVSATAATTTSPAGYTTTTQANAIVTLVNEIRATLVGLGLMVGT